MDYLPVLRDRLTKPLATSDGVTEVVTLMEEYDLLRDDYDNIIDITQWPGMRDPKAVIETKVR